MSRILTLLLITQVSAEWVEISQHHYRKPIRTQSVFTTTGKVIDVEETTKPYRTYNNRSVSEYNWNKNPVRPATGNVKRIQHIGSAVKTTERITFKEEGPDLGVDVIDFEPRPNHGLKKIITEFHEDGKQKGTIERVPNLGNVKRVQLNNSPVKSPAGNFKADREKISNNPYNNGPHSDDLQTDINEFEDKRNPETYDRRIYVNKVNKHQSTKRPVTFAPGGDEKTSYGEEVTTVTTKILKLKHKNYTTVKNVYSTKPTFITETEDFNNYETLQDRFYKITNSKTSEVTEKINVFTTDSNKNIEDITTHKIITKLTTEKPLKNNVHKIKNEDVNIFEVESHENKVKLLGIDEKQVNLDHKINVNNNNVKRKHEPQSKTSLQIENEDKKDVTSDGVQTENNKINTMKNLIKFMKVVADTISKNSRKSFGGKIQYLHELKDSIFANIEDRIDSTWPDDDSTAARRHSRSAQASPRGHHVQFPSSESALMTISFLTFAVFLIKLVLQVIQTYKHKAMMVAPVVVASSRSSGRNVLSNHGHH